VCRENPSPIRSRGHTIVPSPARGEGTKGESRAFWRNEPNEPYLGRPRESGTHNHGLWLWVPALAALGRDDDFPQERRTNLRLWEPIAGSPCLFRPVIYRERCNSNVSSRQRAVRSAASKGAARRARAHTAPRSRSTSSATRWPSIAAGIPQ